MSRGPIPKKAIDVALRIAETRGLVSLCRRGRDSICDLVVHEQGITINVMVRRSRRLHCSLAEMESQFPESLARLRLVPEDPCRSRELWACSPYGTLRFFRVTQTGLVELDRTGKVLSTEKSEAIVISEKVIEGGSV
jgi:hypothetical protein